MTDKQIQVYDTIIKHFGEINQIEKCIEELDELGDELNLYCGLMENGSNKIEVYNVIDKIMGEMADVYNMLIQVKRILSKKHSRVNNKNIARRMYSKNMRTLDRIKTGYYEEE